MFGLSWIKLLIFAAVLLAIGGTVYAGYRYVSGLEADLRTAVASQAKLETALGVEKGAEQWTLGVLKERDERATQFQQTLDDLQQRQTFNRANLDHLNAVLAKHDLGKLADEKPALVQARINAGTRAAIRLRAMAAADLYRSGPAADSASPKTPATTPAAARGH